MPEAERGASKSSSASVQSNMPSMPQACFRRSVSISEDAEVAEILVTNLFEDAEVADILSSGETSSRYRRDTSSTKSSFASPEVPSDDEPSHMLSPEEGSPVLADALRCQLPQLGCQISRDSDEVHS